jgi:hypothetical protein
MGITVREWGAVFYPKKLHPTTHPGGYGIMVITGVCGTLNSGSIPGSRPQYN